MSVEATVRAVNDKLISFADVMPSSNYHHRINYERYNDSSNVHGANLSSHDVDFRSARIFTTVPINIPPPPPHKIVIRNNNNSSSNVAGLRKNRESIKDSSKGYHSDESDGKSSSSTSNSLMNRCSTNSGNKTTKLNSKNSRKNKRTEHSCNKFNSNNNNNNNNSSPTNPYQPHCYSQIDNDNGTGVANVRSTRYYTHFSIRSRQNGSINNGNGRRNNNNQHHHHHHHHQQQQQHHYSMDVILRRVHGLMERFKSRSHMLRIDPNPERLLTGGPSDHLNQAIWDVFVSKAQKENTYIGKLETWKSIFLDVKDCVNSFGLFIVGSTMSGFGLDSSDIDMCLLTKPITCDAKQDAIFHLNLVRGYLLKSGKVEDAELIEAKVPILKFRDSATSFDIDLNCNNGIGIKNTHLLQCYARLDWRVRAMVVIVKVWAQTNDINDAKNMTISSYSLALMVINYLQCGVTPPVLPCLHGLHPELFNSTAESYMDVHDDYEIEFSSDNDNCLGDLLIGFLKYYSHFNFADYAVSVRTGSRLPIDECRYLRAPKNDVNQWKFLCIEEPFNYSNTARSVFDVDKFKFIRDVFVFSYAELARTKNLNTILPVRLPAIVNQR